LGNVNMPCGSGSTPMLAARNLTAYVINAIAEQNIQQSRGGQQPTPSEQQYEIVPCASGRLLLPKLRTSWCKWVRMLIRVKDVGRAGEARLQRHLSLDGSPSVVLIAYQLPGSNAWNTAKSIKAKWRSWKKFSAGLKVVIGLDNTLFVAASPEAFKTLMEAIAWYS